MKKSILQKYFRKKNAARIKKTLKPSKLTVKIFLKVRILKKKWQTLKKGTRNTINMIITGG